MSNGDELQEAIKISKYEINGSEKVLKELGDKDPNQKTKIEVLVNELRELIAGDDLASIKSKTEELRNVSAATYQKIQQEAQNGPKGRKKPAKWL